MVEKVGSGQILNMEPTGNADGFDVKYERKTLLT